MSQVAAVPGKIAEKAASKTSNQVQKAQAKLEEAKRRRDEMKSRM